MDKWDWHRLNGNVAIWSRDKDSISDEEYQKFFKVISKDPSDAQTWIHFKAEVTIPCSSYEYVILKQSLCYV